MCLIARHTILLFILTEPGGFKVWRKILLTSGYFSYALSMMTSESRLCLAWKLYIQTHFWILFVDCSSLQSHQLFSKTDAHFVEHVLLVSAEQLTPQLVQDLTTLITANRCSSTSGGFEVKLGSWNFAGVELFLTPSSHWHSSIQNTWWWWHTTSFVIRQ